MLTHIAVPSLNWPEYSVDHPHNLVFDVNTTGLGYPEPDTYRLKEISYIVNNLYSE